MLTTSFLEGHLPSSGSTGLAEVSADKMIPFLPSTGSERQNPKPGGSEQAVFTRPLVSRSGFYCALFRPAAASWLLPRLSAKQITRKASFKTDRGRDFRKAAQLLVTRLALKPPPGFPRSNRQNPKGVSDCGAPGRPPLLSWDAAAGLLIFLLRRNAQASTYQKHNRIVL